MTDETKTVAVETPGIEIRETVINKGYIDENGKFHSTDEATEAGYVQTPSDVQ